LPPGSHKGENDRHFSKISKEPAGENSRNKGPKLGKSKRQDGSIYAHRVADNAEALPLTGRRKLLKNSNGTLAVGHFNEGPAGKGGVLLETQGSTKQRTVWRASVGRTIPVSISDAKMGD